MKNKNILKKTKFYIKKEEYHMKIEYLKKYEKPLK